MSNLIYQYFVHKKGLPQYAMCSTKSMQHAAERWDVDWLLEGDRFFKDDSRLPHSVYFDIMRLFYDPSFDQYDNILYLDCDTLIHPDAPNIFALEFDDVAAWSEKIMPGAIGAPPHCFNTDTPKCVLARQQLLDLYTANGVQWVNQGVVGTNGSVVPRTVNTGVLLLSKQARLKGRELFDPWQLWAAQNPEEYRPWLLNDQVYLSAMFEKYDLKCTELADNWNCTPSWWPTAHPAHHAINMFYDIPFDPFIYHWSGSDKSNIPHHYNTLYGNAS